MFRPLSLRCWTTQSIAAMTWLTSVPPSATPTLTRHDPRVGCHAAVGGGCIGIRLVRAPSRPAMRPAMNVPWPFVSRLVRFGGLRLEREVGAVDDLAGVASPSTGLTPGVDDRDVDALCRCSPRPTRPWRPCRRSC